MRIILTVAACITSYILYSQDTLMQKKIQADTLTVKWLEEVTVSASRMPEKLPFQLALKSAGY